MSDEAAEEWLAVAATTVAELPADILEHCAALARKTCRHHGQVVPAIIAESEDWLKMRRANAASRIPPERRIERERWSPDLDEIENIKREVAQSLSAYR
jgi:hypothetical protein